MIIISHQERIISLADEIIVVGDRGVIHQEAHLRRSCPRSGGHLSGCPVPTKEGLCCRWTHQVDRELLEKIADLIGKPVGAFNIRKDCGCDGRVSTEHIKIDDRTDGHAGIDIRILDGTKGETCHIPVIITKSGVEETVYNDFDIGGDCDVEIVAAAASTTAATRSPATTASTPSMWAKTPMSTTRKSTTLRGTAGARRS